MDDEGARQIDPEIAVHLGPTFDVGPDNLGQMRAAVGNLPCPTTGSVRASEHLAHRGGAPDVAVRVHHPRTGRNRRPCILSIHGGGYVFGTYDTDDARFAEWCPMLDIVGASVDYRLAPETPYPGPLEDCYTALAWLHSSADELGIDRTKIGVAGVSAGGGLAAGLALLARDRHLPVAFLLLEYPMLDDRQVTPSSRRGDLAVWTRRSNEFGWRSYLGPLHGGDEVPAYAAPARSADLAGLPPTFVAVGAADGFLDEDVDFALRLNRAGGSCELHVYPGAPHGYRKATPSTVAMQAKLDVERWLHRQLTAT